VNKTQFVKLAKKELKKYNIKCVFSKKELISESYSGYFDSLNKILAVSRGNWNWFGIFLHEYCHFLQWRDGKGIGDVNSFYDWIQNGAEGEYTQKDFIKARNHELDCEKRVVKLIDKHNLPIDKDEYIQQANFMMLNYNYINSYTKNWEWDFKKGGRWKMHNEMPTELLKVKDCNEKIPRKYLKLIRKYSYAA
jgi:hypothetical protein